MAGDYLKEPVPAPNLNIPKGNTCIVRVIDSTTCLRDLQTSLFVTSPVEGHDKLTVPAYSTLITHESKHYLFDLGVRKDFDHLPPALWQRVSKLGKITVEKNVADILEEDTAVGVKPEDIEAVIWSHHHFDHIGDLSTFPKSTGLVIGPGFRERYLPGYPENPEGVLYSSDFEDRKVREIDFSKGLKIGSCPAFDFFGDGSLYLLDTPGHTTGHICGLVRTSADPDTFVLLGGDVSHHGGEFRPTKYLPLPKSVEPSALPKLYPKGCPGELLEKIHPSHNVDTPFYHVRPGFSDDDKLAEQAIDRLQDFDAQSNVLTIIAHDGSLAGQLPFFPRSINQWHDDRLNEKSRWRFTEDFKVALEKAADSQSAA